MITLWVSRDGMVSLEKIEPPVPDPHEEFGDIMRDAVVEASKRGSTVAWEKVYRTLEKHEECLDELGHDEITWMLPLIVAKTAADAKRAIVRFCKMGVGRHQLLAATDRWYYIPWFEGTVEDIFKWSRKFDEFLRDG